MKKNNLHKYFMLLHMYEHSVDSVVEPGWPVARSRNGHPCFNLDSILKSALTTMWTLSYIESLTQNWIVLLHRDTHSQKNVSGPGLGLGKYFFYWRWHSPHFCDTFPRGSSYVLTKRVGLHFGRFFRKNILSLSSELRVVTFEVLADVESVLGCRWSPIIHC
jgi:hypothetical protein